MPDHATEFARLFLVFCLQKLPDGSYIALNRSYRPVGTLGREWVEYEASPARFKFKRALSERQVLALSHDGDTNPERIYLWGEKSFPTSSDSAWAAYIARLQRLAGWKVVTA